LKDERLNKIGMKDETDEIYTLSEYKKEDENTHHGGGTRGSGYDQDEDDENVHHTNAQCANQ